jgi:hypothetical protein
MEIQYTRGSEAQRLGETDEGSAKVQMRRSRVQKCKGGGKRDGVAWGTAGRRGAEPRGEMLAGWQAAKQKPAGVHSTYQPSNGSTRLGGGQGRDGVATEGVMVEADASPTRPYPTLDAEDSAWCCPCHRDSGSYVLMRPHFRQTRANRRGRTIRPTDRARARWRRRRGRGSRRRGACASRR